MWQNIRYIVEVDPRERKVVKRHMTMGKLVHEDVHVTEDGKTAYITDDTSQMVLPAVWAICLQRHLKQRTEN